MVLRRVVRKRTTGAGGNQYALVCESLGSALSNHLGTGGFTLKLNGFGKFSVRHKLGILRRIPFTGETILTKDRRMVAFVSLGSLRQQERIN